MHRKTEVLVLNDDVTLIYIQNYQLLDIILPLINWSENEANNNYAFNYADICIF